MTDTRLKLVFAMTMAVVALLLASLIVVVGMLRELTVADLIALAAVPGGFATMSAGFIFGHSNGANGVKADLAKLAAANGGPT